MKYSVVIAAAGSSTRFNHVTSKMLYCFQDGTRVIDRALQLFIDDDDCRQIVVSATGDVFEYLTSTRYLGKMIICNGGATRQQSVMNGLMACTEDITLVHDGARCYLTKADLSRLKNAVTETTGAILCRPETDTVKEIDEEGCISKTIDRSKLRRAQTPQAFRTDELIRCYRLAAEDGFTATDDAQIIEKYSYMKIKLVEATGHNTKITTIDDIKEG